jgi:2-polyprenyl-3-methyl-5-hydroxy-6-metoxy-1,4-benzoquinol methylase
VIAGRERGGLPVVAEQVAEHYDSYPFPGRANAYGAWTELAPRLLRSVGLAPEQLAGARVLDAGCGTGEYSRSLRRLGADVVSLDISAGAIARARAVDRELEIAEGTYVRGDLLQLAVAGPFDYVLSLGVLHHTGDAARGFEALRDLVRPGGYFVVGLYNSVSRAHIAAIRKALQIASRNDRERAIDLAQRYCMPLFRRYMGDGANDRARIADLLVNPHERPVSLRTALRWYERGGLSVVGSSPSHRIEDYRLASRLLPVGRRSWLAHRLIELAWLRWQADYFVIAGRA